MKRILVLIVFVSLALTALSWGGTGHKIVAAFARQSLKSIDKDIADSVQYFLDKMSFEEAAVWMDDIKSESKEYNEWHYVNVEKDNTYVKTKDPNVINKIEWAINELHKKGRDKEKTAFALRVLFHLIGDLHQPLHCGYGEDKGGNDVFVSYAGEQVKLHALWDSGIIKEENITLQSCFDFANKMNIKEKTAAQKIDVEQWMQESRALLPFVYGYGNGKINASYSSDAKVIIERQLVKAGIRLTAVLYLNFRKADQGK